MELVGGGDELAADSPMKVRGTRHKTGPELEGLRRVMRGLLFMLAQSPVCSYAKREHS